ncbi:hypothetical protein C7959_1348 [Orenia marismortui]|uniref:Cof subfamily protein (Haloacid dehalogenase superfamily)/HAD superfamily hydrolase (TIGR01484 family) n=1 Tax=Orenia marismortui TaxID=46469 RepID=A0A4R8GWD9_9FIRM|nr:hypothetical protein C7959_1348 [Orenia marismortui]
MIILTRNLLYNEELETEDLYLLWGDIVKFKLVAIDMDGTLLNDDHKVSDKNREIITKYANQGVNFVLASGRPYQALYPYTKELEVYLPLVTSNGSIVKCPLTESVYTNSSMPLDLAKEILDYGYSKGYGVSLYFEDEVITSHEEVAKVHRELEGIDPTIITKYQLEEGPTKIVFFADPEDIDKAFAQLADKYEGDLYITRSDERCVETMNLEVSKGKALKYMIKRMNIASEEVLAIGNNFNDVAMFEEAGLAVAMGNSPEGVKEVADFVTKSNQEDGVAYALEKFLKD